MRQTLTRISALNLSMKVILLELFAVKYLSRTPDQIDLNFNHFHSRSNSSVFLVWPNFSSIISTDEKYLLTLFFSRARTRAAHRAHAYHFTNEFECVREPVSAKAQRPAHKSCLFYSSPSAALLVSPA